MMHSKVPGLRVKVGELLLDVVLMRTARADSLEADPLPLRSMKTH